MYKYKGKLLLPILCVGCFAGAFAFTASAGGAVDFPESLAEIVPIVNFLTKIIEFISKIVSLFT